MIGFESFQFMGKIITIVPAEKKNVHWFQNDDLKSDEIKVGLKISIWTTEVNILGKYRKQI